MASIKKKTSSVKFESLNIILRLQRDNYDTELCYLFENVTPAIPKKGDKIFLTSPKNEPELYKVTGVTIEMIKDIEKTFTEIIDIFLHTINRE